MNAKTPNRSFWPGVLSAAVCLMLLVVLPYTEHYGLRDGALATPLSTHTQTDQVGNFALLDQNGRYHQLYRYGATARAVVLFAHSIDCRAMKSSLPALKALYKRYAQHEVSVLLINANPRNSRSALQREAARLGTDMPILKDEHQLVVESLGIRRIGEALVIDTRTWRIVYRGPVDNRMQADRPSAEARQPVLHDAVEAVLAGRPVATATPLPPEAGCLITPDKEKEADASYAQDVAPILADKCVPCHQAGGVAPWAMDRYESVTSQSASIRDAVMTRHMPPWDAAPAYGGFSNDPSLSRTQARALIRWIDAGNPRGDGPDPLAQATSATLPEWPLGAPDLVIEVPPQSVPAGGVIDYRNVDIPLPLDRDVWVRAVDMQPGNRAVLHHCLVFVIYPPQRRARQPNWKGGGNSYFAAYAPGYNVEPFPYDTGQLLPKGSVLQFQLHYNAVGHATSDSPRLALYFHKRPPTRELVVESAHNTNFRIPPHAPDYPVEASYMLKKDALLHGMFAHLHMRGSRISYEARHPNGRREMLLSVPRYRFDHQIVYLLRQPTPLSAGTKIVVRGAFDNSPLNPANPDPSKEVISGVQSWDEMFIGYLLYSVPRIAAK
jgi:peroxiredoxin